MSEPGISEKQFFQLTDRLLRAWTDRAARPEIASFMSVAGLSPDQVLELCLVDQAQRWKSGAPMLVEDYLAIWPGQAASDDHVFELLYGEVRQRRVCHQAQPEAELIARFPQFSTRLKQQLAVGDWFSGGLTIAESQAGGVVPDFSVDRKISTTQFGRYELLEVIYRALDTRLQRTVAIKIIRPDQVGKSTYQLRFAREMELIAQLEHPNIVPIYDVGECDGIAYFTMKLMEGGDLQVRAKQWVDRPREAVKLMIEIADAVHFAHQLGVLHRDLKPSNVLLDHASKPHVTDFGLAKRFDQPTTSGESDGLLGTPIYLPPERLGTKPKPLTVAADVYGLGTICYVLLTGRPPFTSSDFGELVHQVRTNDPPSVRQLNRRVAIDLERICAKAMAKEPSARYASALEFADDLRRYLGGQPVLARPLSWWQHRRRWIAQHPDLAIVSAILFLVSSFLIGMLAVQSMHSQRVRVQLVQTLAFARFHESIAATNRWESESLRASAEGLKTELETATTEVLRQNDLATSSLYAASMQTCDLAWRNGDSVEFSRLMDEQVPGPGQADQRGFEWYLLDQLYRPRANRWPHLTQSVRCLAFSPDGKWLAAAGDPGEIKLFDADSGKAVASWLSLTTMRCLDFSPVLTEFVCGGDDGRLYRYIHRDRGNPSSTVAVASLPIWFATYLANGQDVVTCDQAGVIRIIDANGQCSQTMGDVDFTAIQGIAIDHTRKLIFAGHADAQLSVWDIEQGVMIQRFQQHGLGQIKTLACSNNGHYLVTGCTDRTVQVFDIRNLENIRVIQMGHHFDRVQQVAIDANNRQVAACDKNGAIRIWNVGELHKMSPELERKPNLAWQAYSNRAYAIAFDPHSSRVATGGQASFVSLWDLDRSEPEMTLGDAATYLRNCRSLAVDKGTGQVLATTGNGVEIWDTALSNRLATLSEANVPRDKVALSEDGKLIATSDSESRLVEVWQWTTAGYKILWKLDQQASVGLAFSPLADFLAVADWNDDRAVVYNMATGEIEWQTVADQCQSIEFSPDGRWLAFTEQDDAVVWDWPTKQPHARLKGHISTVTDVRFSPDGLTLATGGRDRKIGFWNPHTGQLRRLVMGHRDYVRMLAFVGNDRLVSLDDDGTVIVWESDLGIRLCNLYENLAQPCMCITVSPDHQRLLLRMASGRVRSLALRTATAGDVSP